MPLELRKQKLAEEDLLDIWLFSAERWDTETADLYLDGIADALERLRNTPRLGAPLDFSFGLAIGDMPCKATTSTMSSPTTE